MYRDNIIRISLIIEYLQTLIAKILIKNHKKLNLLIINHSLKK